MGVLPMSRNGSKVGNKVGFDPFGPAFAPQNPLLDPFQEVDKNPSETHFKRKQIVLQKGP